jgi:pyruvate dehydrogenase E2 component (dihydrolipoamide acetyltransferase)
MMRYVFRLPDVGEGIHEAEIVSYLVKVGDQVQADKTIMKVETDKAVVDLPAPVNGVVAEIPNQPGDVVAVGDPLIIIETEEAIAVVAPEEAVAEAREEEIEKAVPLAAASAETVDAGAKAAPPKRALATPHTRHLARELGVDINRIKGTGSGGRITDEDVRLAVKAKAPERPKIPRIAAEAHEPSTIGFEFEKYGPTRRVPLKGVRKRIAEVMVRSFSTIPHVAHGDEADVTDLLYVVKKQKPLAEERGVKLTMLSFICKAAASALQEFPEVNSSLDEESGELVYKDYYHIGIATDAEQGLTVPVVRDVDKKSILQVAEAIQNLVQKARDRTIDLEDLRGGTFTVTNPGGIGGTFATPIILHPQVAILGILQGRKRPVVREDQMVVRTVMPLVISFDHRLLDGATVARFLNHIIMLLEDPMRMLVDVI